MLSIFIINSSFGQALQTKYKITGYTSQKAGKARLLLYINRSQFVPYDSTDINNGIFTFSGTLDEPKSFQLLIGDKGRILFVGNENIAVDDRNGKTGEITVNGSRLSHDYDEYFNYRIAPLLNRTQLINQTLDSLGAKHPEATDSLTRLQDSLFGRIPDSAAAFIRQNPSSFVSLYLLNYNADSYNIETIARLFNRLDTSLKRYPSAQFIRRKIQLGGRLPVICPSFSVKDESGQIVTLSSFKGNYLLIDFWAGWCAPCLKDLLFIKKAAERFQHQNFKVLTASLDINRTAWKAVVEKYNLSERCRNIFLPNEFGNLMAIQLQASVIPRMILIDPNGKIIENNIRTEELNSRLEKIFTVSVDDDGDVALIQSKAANNP